jgi:ribose transport system substrate-binding protein
MNASSVRGWTVLFVALVSSVSAASPKIGVLLKDKNSSYWGYVEKGAVDAGKALGVEVTVRQAPTVQNVGAQSVLLKALQQGGIDALVVAPISTENLQAPIAAIAAKGTKIVTIDGAFSGGVGDTFIGNDQNAMSDAAAHLCATLVDDGDEMAVFRFNNVDRPVVERESRVIQVLRQAKPGLKLYADVYGSSEKDAEVAQARVLLNQHPKVKVVLASATVTTLAMIQVLNERRQAGKIKLVGFGTYLPVAVGKSIEEGTVAGWVAQQPREIGRKAVEAAVALLANKQVPPVQYAEFVLITKSNLHAPEIEALATP